jgi:SAM-dependent methyltransferase
MRLPPDLAAKYYRPFRDVDAEQFWEAFEAPPSARVIEVGCNDSYVANMLQEMGYKVCGVDLRPYGASGEGVMSHGCNYQFMQADFTTLDMNIMNGTFDVGVSISAIEHFGLGTYGEQPSPDADVIAMTKIYNLLKPGGTCYVTMPYAKDFVVWGIDWRVYNEPSLRARIIQRFEVVDERHFFSWGFNEGEFFAEQGDVITKEQADEWPPYPPHCTVLLVLHKPV